jgi:disulfide bond formation protein DsbB
MKRDLVYALLALAVLILSVVPIGSAVFVLGFIFGDSPCVMCWEQRMGMAIIALIGIFVLRYGPKPKYIGLSVFVGAWGIFMGLRHTGMHAARDVGQGFSVEILGAHTYTWALFIFWICVVTMSWLLMFLQEGDILTGPRTWKVYEKLVASVFLIVIAGNIVQSFASTGPPPFVGQGDPIRFSFNPRHWVWSLDEWSSAPISLRGRWGIEKPSIGSVSSDPGSGPLAGLPLLAIKEKRRTLPELRGTPTDLAYDRKTDRFLVTTQHGVYLLDGTLSKVMRYTVVDPGYSVDLGQFSGAAIVGDQAIVAMGENKSYVTLRESETADAEKNFRYFLEAFDQFDEITRSRLGTVRARMMYAMSLAYNPETNSLYTVTVPNAKVRQMVISRFNWEDRILSEEFVPTLATDSGLKAAGAKRSIHEYYVTGATIEDGRLYAISAAFNTLLAIDLSTRSIVSARAVPGLVRPAGIAAKGTDFYIIGEEGDIFVVARP